MSLHGDAAAVYASRGWRVVPTWPLGDDGLCTCPARLDPDHTAAGKHPRVKKWQEAATTDLAVVREWWSQWPDANVSVATGAGSGFFVVDVDPRHGGIESLQEWGEVPRTLRATTGGGGFHLFYRVPWDGRVVRNRTNVLPGVDVRGEGGQIVAPPSRHRSGGFYTWADMWEEGPQEASAELLELVLGAGPTGDREASESTDLPSASEILRGVPVGERNDTLFRWACSLRQKLGDDRVAVEVLVREAGRASGLDPAEVSLLLESAFAQDHTPREEYGVSEAQEAWAREAASLSPGGVLLPAAGGLVGETGSLALPLTDDGNSLRFVREVGAEFRFAPQTGQWYRWDGRRWDVCVELEHETAAVGVARRIWAEVAEIEDKETAAAVERWARGSQMRGKIDAMLMMVRPKLAINVARLDADDWKLNVANGTLDLKTGCLEPHNRTDLFTQIVETEYQEDARCDGWEAFLEMVLPDPNVRWFVQKAVGYSLTGVTDAKALFILYGAGSNGKSVFLEALKENVIGEYAGVAPKTLVMMERDEHATQLAGMQGKRFVTLSEEVEEKDRLRTATLKSITGGDMMTARFMRQDFFNFQPKLKLWIATNHRPGINEFGDAMRTRLRLVPFTIAIPEQMRRPREDVLAEFRAERSGLLAWALRGASGWLREGLESPSVMSDAVDTWFSDEDTFGQWVSEVGLVSDPAMFMKTADLHVAYATWMMMRGEDRFTMSPKSMGKRLTSAGFHNGKFQGARGWFVNFAVAPSCDQEQI